MLVVTPHPQLGRVVHRRDEHLRLVVPVVRIRELDKLDVVHRHVVEHQHVLDAHVLLDAPPVVLDRVQALGDPDLLALQILHPEDPIVSPHRHAAALVHPGRPEQHRAADVRMDVDRRVETAEADQVVEVVNVVRVPIVLRRVPEVGVLDADLLELLPAPPKLLVDVVRRDHGAVGEPDLVPAQRDGGGDPLHLFGDTHRTTSASSCLAHSNAVHELPSSAFRPGARGASGLRPPTLRQTTDHSRTPARVRTGHAPFASLAPGPG